MSDKSFVKVATGLRLPTDDGMCDCGHDTVDHDLVRLYDLPEGGKAVNCRECSFEMRFNFCEVS